MWEMIDSDFDIDCGNECGPGPPPMFRIPPPPRPPFLQEVSKCSEDALNDYEMCEAIPVSSSSFIKNILNLCTQYLRQFGNFQITT